MLTILTIITALLVVLCIVKAVLGLMRLTLRALMILAFSGASFTGVAGMTNDNIKNQAIKIFSSESVKKIIDKKTISKIISGI